MSRHPSNNHVAVVRAIGAKPRASAMPPGASLRRNAFGKLVFEDAAGGVHEDVFPVRAFPIDAALENIALVSAEGHELLWIERLADLAAADRALIVDELDAREFMPEISRILEVSSYATPSHWRVETDRGPTRLTLKSEQDIRRVAGPLLLISDDNGIHFLIRDMTALDRQSRKLLDRFL